MHNRIKEIRKSQKLTQKELGEMLGVSRDAIANIENNRVDASDLFINHFCRELNVNKKYILTGSGDPFLNGITEKDHELADLLASLTLYDNPKLNTLMEKITKLDDEYIDLIDKLVSGLIKE